MVVNIGKNQFKSFLLHKVSILALSVIAARCQIPPFVAARHLPPGRGKSALKVGALGSPRKLHLFAKASPFGRGVTVGDGEGEPAEIIRSCRMPLRPLPVKKLLRNARRRF